MFIEVPTKASVSFTIGGVPRTKENKGQFNRNYYFKNHSEIVAWEKEAAKIAKAAMEKAGWQGPWKGRCAIKANFRFNDYTRRDITNFWKSLNDALNGVVYVDDSQIDFSACTRQVSKDTPGVDVWVYFYDHEFHPVSRKRPREWRQLDVDTTAVPLSMEIITEPSASVAHRVGEYRNLEATAKPAPKKKKSASKPKARSDAKARSSAARRRNSKTRKAS